MKIYKIHIVSECGYFQHTSMWYSIHSIAWFVSLTG